MKNIKKNFQQYFKNFFYKVLSLFTGRIKGKIKSENDSRISVKKIEKEKKLVYKIFNISNGRLYTDRIHDTAVILDDHIVEGPSHQLRPINNAKVEENIVFKKGTPRKKRELKGVTLSLLTGGAGNDNYFHWMFDVLPRLALSEEVIKSSKIDFFLIPSSDQKFQSETLKLLDIPKNKILSSKIYRHISSNELIITDHPYCVSNDATNDIQKIPIWISQWLKNKFLRNEKKNFNYPKKIYIDRGDSKSNTKYLRSIVNEPEIKNFLKAEGFELIKLGHLSFSEQVGIFSKAEIIVGLHGAGFADLCFCKENTKILELKNKTAGKMYENLAVTNKLIYKSISGESENLRSKNQFGHITISLDDLKKEIKNFE